MFTFKKLNEIVRTADYTALLARGRMPSQHPYAYHWHFTFDYKSQKATQEEAQRDADDALAGFMSSIPSVLMTRMMEAKAYSNFEENNWIGHARARGIYEGAQP